MIILFPKRKGAKIATTIISKELREASKIREASKSSSGYFFVLGMIYFAAKFGAITYKEQIALTDYLNEKMGFNEREQLTPSFLFLFAPGALGASYSDFQQGYTHTALFLFWRSAWRWWRSALGLLFGSVCFLF